MRRKLILGLALAAASSTLIDAAADEPARHEEKLIDRVAALVNDEVITLSEVRAAAEPALHALPPDVDHDAAYTEAMRQALDALIGETLLEQETRKREIAITEAEIDRAIIEVRRQHGLTDSQFRQAIQAQGYTWEAYRDELKGQLERYRLLGAEVQSRVEITDEDIQSHLGRQGVGRPVAEARVRHILLRLPEGASEAETEEVEQQAEELRRRIEAGEDFAAVASESSEDPSAASGGDLGWLRQGRMIRVLDEAVFEASPRELVGPVRSPSGYHVIEVVERRQKRDERDELIEQRAHQELMEEALEQETRRFIDRLRRRAVIDIKVSEITP